MRAWGIIKVLTTFGAIPFSLPEDFPRPSKASFGKGQQNP